MKRWSFNLYNQWPAIFDPKNHNWIDFTFFKASLEWDKYLGNFNWDFSLLGLNISGGYTYDPENENLKELERRLDELFKEKGDGN